MSASRFKAELTTVIDVHTHVCPFSFPTNPSSQTNKRWPCMCAGQSGQAELMIEDKAFRKLDARSWDVARRIEDMDCDGVSVQVLSPMPELLSYWFDTEDGTALGDYINGVIAQMIAMAPLRFKGFGMVPMQDVPAAIVALQRVKDVFGLSGVQIGTHVNGVMLGDVRFEPFWTAAESLELAIFVHPLHPLTARNLNVAPLFHPLVGFPIDTAIAGGSLLIAGVLDRYPNLRIGLSHGGGGLAPVVHRLDQAWTSMESFRKICPTRPSESAARLFYDSNVYDARFLAYISNTIARGQVFLGTDYPYEIMQTRPRDYLNDVLLPPTALESLAHKAAERFLGL